MAYSKHSYEGNEETKSNKSIELQLQAAPAKKAIKTPKEQKKIAKFLKKYFSLVVLVVCVVIMGLFGLFGYLMTTVKPKIPEAIKLSLEARLYEDNGDKMCTPFEKGTISPFVILDPIESYGPLFEKGDKKGITYPCATTKWYASDLSLINKRTTPMIPELKIKRVKKRQSANDTLLISEEKAKTLIRDKVRELLKLTEYTFTTPEKRKGNITNNQPVTVSENTNNKILENESELIIKKLVQDILDSTNENITSHKKYIIKRDKEPPDKTLDRTVIQIMQKLGFLSRFLNKMTKTFDLMLENNTDLLRKLDDLKLLANESSIFSNVNKTTEDFYNKTSENNATTIATDIVLTTNKSDSHKNENIYILTTTIVNYTKSPLLNQSKSTSEEQTHSTTIVINQTDNATITSPIPILAQITNRSDIIKNNSYIKIQNNSNEIDETIHIERTIANLTKMIKQDNVLRTLTDESNSSSAQTLRPSGLSESNNNINKLNYSNNEKLSQNNGRIKLFYTTSRAMNTFVKFIRRKNYG